MTGPRTADADVDNVANALAGVSFPLPAANTIRECGHPVQYGMDLRHHVLAVDQDGGPFRRAQRDMQDRPLLGDVDLVSAKHGVDPRLQPGLPSQFDQQLDGIAGNAILRVVEQQAQGLNRELLAALRVSREQVAQVQGADLLMVGLESIPCLQFNQ
jgi:hypothetical protein